MKIKHEGTLVLLNKTRDLRAIVKMAKKHKRGLGGAHPYAYRFSSRSSDLAHAAEALCSQLESRGSKASEVGIAIRRTIPIFSDPLRAPVEILSALTVLEKTLSGPLSLLGTTSATLPAFSLPTNLPLQEAEDMREAVIAFDSGCFYSAMVMARRAYEGLLTRVYTQTEGRKAVEVVKCTRCGTVATERPLTVSELHKWASSKGILRSKLKDYGGLIFGIGAGGAHPTANFPRDPQVASITISAACVLTSDLAAALTKTN